MKKLSLFTFCSLLFWACNNTTNPTEEKTETAKAEEVQQEPAYQSYGDSISPEGAVEVNQLMAMLNGEDSLAVKVEGKVNSSCAKKGCWMKMDLGNDEEMHVTFKDYEFFVPKNLNGQKAIIEGYASVDTLDVAYLKHLAQDAGKSEEEIAEITEPEVSLTYVATGVLIRDEDEKL